MRRWDGKQRQFQQNSSEGVPSDAQFVASSPSPSSPPARPYHSPPSVFGTFSKTTAKMVHPRNERVINRGVSPMSNKDCVSMSPTTPRLVVEHRPASAVSFVPKAVPCPSSSSTCHPELCFDPSYPISTSPSFVPSSPAVPSSPKWCLDSQGSNARTVPKSAMLMSKCQSFLRSSSVLIPPTPSSVSVKHQKAKNDTINQQQISENREIKDDNECIFNFEGLFEMMDDARSGGNEGTAAKEGHEKTVESEETKDWVEKAVESEKTKDGAGRAVESEAAKDGAGRAVENEQAKDGAGRAVESEKAKDGAERAVESEKAKDGAGRAVESEEAKDGIEGAIETNKRNFENSPAELLAVETVCLLSFARNNEIVNVKCNWPHSLIEHCTIRSCQQKERPSLDEATEIGEGMDEDEGAMPREEKRGENQQETREEAQKQSRQSRGVRRATRPHPRRGRPPPLDPIGADLTMSAPFSVLPFLDPSAGICSTSPSTSTTSPSIPSNAIYSIRIGGIQLRNVPASSMASRAKDVQMVVAIRMDRREVFRSCPVHLNENCCVISEEFCMELPRSSLFHSLQLSLFELTEGARIQRCIGRLRLTRHELVAYGNAIQDRWLPIARIRPSELTETLGAICAELSWNGQHKMLTLRVFDFTIWTLPTNNGRLNLLQRHCNEGGRLYLKCRLGFGHYALSTMQKMRLVERRCVEPVRFDCSNLFVDKVGQRPSHHHHQETSSPRSLEEEWLSCRSPCGTPTSAFSAKEHFRFNSRHFKFPPPPSPTLFHQQQNRGQKTPSGSMLLGEPHLYIKLYGKANYSEDSLCGFVHIPLEAETMKPRETPHGPNWFNIRSRAETTILTQFPTFASNNSAFSSSTSKQLTTSELNSTPPSPFLRQKQPQTTRQQQFPCTSDFSHHRRFSVVPSNSSPSLHRHCSPASACASSTSTFTKSGSGSHPTVANTRLTLLTTPSITPFSLSGGNELDNASPLLSRKSNQQQQQRHLEANQPFASSSQSASNNQQNSGEVRLKLWYDMDEVHPFVNYRRLYLNLVRSLNVDPHACSLISLIQCLPVDLENLAKPLMKIFVHSSQIRQFFRAICMDYVKSCNDVNTLFRSQSLASKVMYEMMKFVGHNYLSTSLRPLIDLIFAERKCCEIDPSKLKPGDSLEHNFRSITTYAELAFDQVVNSFRHCPKALRELFAELRGVVEQIYPNRQDVARLAVSSFLIMRFFAAAILNPKLFALKLETPDVEVARTLVLVSKILQRISNCVVSAHPLTNKEQWLTPVLQRFTDRDKIAMIQFLDKVSKNDADDSCQPSEMSFVNNENISPVSSSFYETTVLKSGYLIERRCRPIKKRSFKNLIHPKRRFVLLTDSLLIWHKSAKDGTAPSTSSLMSNSLSMGSDFNAGTEQQKSQIALSDVTSVSVLSDAKNAFRVTTMSTEVHFQANNETELNEWIILIQKQQRRHLMVKNQAVLNAHAQQQIYSEIDLARELHTVYTNLESHMDTLCEHNWCCRFECARCGVGKNAREGCETEGTDHRRGL